MPTQAEIEQHQQDIEELSALAVAAMATVVLAAGEEDDEEATLLAAIPATLEPYMSAAAQLAAEWYRGLAREEPRPPARTESRVPPIVGPADRKSLLDALEFEPRPAELPPREQIEATVRWAMHQPTPEPPRDAEEESPEAPKEQAEEPRREDAPSRQTEQPRASQQSDTPRLSARVTVGAAAVPIPASAARTAAPAQEVAQEAHAQEEPPRARVVSADETSSRAGIIPAEATEEQARTISRLAGATQRYVHSAARRTITDNAFREDVRWARHAQPDACAFCRMLATRGPDYRTKATASKVGASGRVRGSRASGDDYHDDCGCVPVPVRSSDSYEPPDYIADWTEQYYAAVDVVGNAYDTAAILAVMRAAEKENGGSSH